MRRLILDSAKWICEEGGCEYSGRWRKATSWSSADSSAKSHNERTGHRTSCARTIMRRYDGIPIAGDVDRKEIARYKRSPEMTR